jgi:transposase/Fe-S cluster biogenesis protein NfuA
MSYKMGIDMDQTSFEPMCMDMIIGEDHICRFIEAYTKQLDMAKLGFKYAEPKEVGCRPFDPRMMLNLYIYGYLNRIRSSRRLEAETRRNIEVMWLMRGLTPDDKTICNFRTDNSKAIRGAFKEFSLICHKLGLYGGEVIGVDGTKIRANNSRKNNYNQITVKRRLERIEKRISEYMNMLEESDAEERDEKNPTAEEIRAALEKLKDKKIKYTELWEQVQASGEVSTVDPDAKLMHTNGDGRRLDVCHNVQTAVDDKHGLIVDFQAADSSSDKGGLSSITESAKEILETEEIIALADTGFYDGEDIVKCEENGTTCLVSKPKPGGQKKEEEYSRDKFAYDKSENCYTCPGGQKLSYMRLQKHSGGKYYHVYANYGACGLCPMREKCTKSKYRTILRSLYQDVMDVVDARTKRNKDLYRKRQAIVEHPYGTVKSIWGYRNFLCRRKIKVIAEASLAFLAYNLRRFLTICANNGWKAAEIVAV